MVPSPLRITLARKTVPELLGKVFLRVWHGVDEVPEWFVHGLNAARPCLGHGVLDPLELRLTETEMTTVSVGTDGGKTLMETLYSSMGFCETDARSILEQVCFGLLRIHEGQNAVHGAITPFNLHRTDAGLLKLWSVPSARLELSFGEMDKEWEMPFRSLQVLDGNAPTFQDDIYSLGILFARLLCCDKDHFTEWQRRGSGSLELSEGSVRVLEKCTCQAREERYGSVRELIEDLDPTSLITKLDLAGAAQDKDLGYEAFRDGRIGDASAHWQDALRKDWLDATSHNNLAIYSCASGDWETAILGLEKAYKLSSHHPLINCNIGYCQYKLGDLSAADYWLRRAGRINPGFWQPLARLAEMSRDSGHLETSLKLALEGLSVRPKSKTLRLLAAEAFENVGDLSEANAQKAYAEKLNDAQPFADYLITDKTRPPWNLMIDSGATTLLDRFGLDASKPGRLDVADWIKRKALNRTSKYGEPESPSFWLGFPRGEG